MDNAEQVEKPVEAASEKETVAMLFHVDKALRGEFKAACKRRGVTMAEALQSLMLGYAAKAD